MSLATNPGLISVTFTPESRSSGVIAFASARTANLLMLCGEAPRVGAAPPQRPHREFAHAIRRSSRRRRPSRNAPDDGDVAFVFLDLRKRGVNRSQHSKHVGLKLPPIVFHREVFEWAN